MRYNPTKSKSKSYKIINMQQSFIFARINPYTHSNNLPFKLPLASMQIKLNKKAKEINPFREQIFIIN